MKPLITKQGNTKIVNVEMRAYIQWEGRWRHVYIVSSLDQTTLLGEPVRMLQFKLSRRSKDTFIAEKIKFHKKKPAVRTRKKEVEA